VDGLEVLHTAGVVRRGDLTDVLVSDVANPPSTTTRIGHRHPRTGNTVLYASEQMTKEVVGLSHDDSEALLGELFAHLYDSGESFDHEWRERDFVIWDNVAMQHARKNVAIEGPARTLRKVASPVPVLGFDQRPVFSAPK
jgi:alpha-ketoglutarate-dependent taurine dioxygenase